MNEFGFTFQVSHPGELAPPDLSARACTIDALLGSLNALGDISAPDIDVHALLRATSVCYCVMRLVRSIDGRVPIYSNTDGAILFERIRVQHKAQWRTRVVQSYHTAAEM